MLRQGETEVHTIFWQCTHVLYFLHAVDREACWVAFCGHFLLVHIDHMLQFWDPWKHILDKKGCDHNRTPNHVT